VSGISVIIPTLDRPKLLSKCLQTLVASFPQDAETIVVSDGGTVSLEPYIEPFVESLRLRYVRAPHRGPAAARNYGLEVARGRIVLFTDDDCQPRPGWVASLASGVSLSPPGAVGGITLNGVSANPYDDAAQVVLDLVARHDTAMGWSPRFFPSNNLAFPAETLRAIGGFDESFRTAEDRELCRRWRHAGFSLNRVPEAIVEHAPNLDFRGFVRQFLAYGRGAAQFHASSETASFRESVGFHLRLPIYGWREMLLRGLGRGAKLAGLLLVWEFLTFAGFLAGGVTTISPSATSQKADLSRRTP
jgi:GT2 family glycosyltransferase